jgi:hypothetical protein
MSTSNKCWPVTKYEEALQSHHDKFVKLYRDKKLNNPDDWANYNLAIERERNKKVMPLVFKFKIGLICFVSLGFITNGQDILDLLSVMEADFPGLQPGDVEFEPYIVGESKANWFVFKPEDPNSIPEEYLECKNFDKFLEIICSV